MIAAIAGLALVVLGVFRAVAGDIVNGAADVLTGIAILGLAKQHEELKEEKQ